jgi:hypothetical protein
MAERLGEMLLHIGALTQAQLEEVLSAQSVYGGRIGTNLVEMGLLSEQDLARVLNEKLGVPCIDASCLGDVPSSVLAQIPREMAERFRVLPVALDGKRLTIAMADPSDFRAIDEIGFATGLVLVPRVCPDLRLTLALERYYGIKRPVRFLPVQGGSRTRLAEEFRLNGAASEGAVAYQLPAAEAETMVAGSVSGMVNSGHALRPRGGIAGKPVMDELARRFVVAIGEVEVVSVLMSYLSDEFDRAAFLNLRRGSAIGVQAVAGGAAVHEFPGWVVGLEDATYLRQVLVAKEPFIGVLPDGGAEQRIQAKLGGRQGSAVLLLPLLVEGMSVAFLHVEDEKGRLAPGLFDLRRVVAKAELAFEMLGIRKRITIV